MKKTIKVIVLILAILQILPMLFACTNPAPDAPTEDETTPAETEAPEAPASANLMKDGKLLYTAIRYASDPEDSVYDSVKKLREKIQTITGTMPTLKPDYSNELQPPDSSTFEILVGPTNYPESKQVLNTVLFGDYKIAVVGNKIVIAAHSAKEITRAINYICNTMLKKKDESGNLLLEITEYEYITEKKLIEVSINGNPINNYTIIYGTANNSKDHSYDVATKIRDAIAGSTGYILEVLKDSDASKCSTPRKLYVGTQFKNLPSSVNIEYPGEMCYYGKTIGDDFYIITGGYLSGTLSTNQIIRDYFTVKSVGEKIDIKDFEETMLDVVEQPKTEGTEFRVMTYNIMAQWAGWGGDYMPVPQRYEAFKAIIDGYSPDVVGLQEVSSQWSEKILNEMGDTYTFVNRKTPDGKFVNLSTIIYKHDKFDLIDSGLQYFSYNGPNQIRLVNWAIFKDKKTGKQFAFFNTHWMFYSVDDNDGQRKAHSEEHAVIINKVMANHPDVKYAFSTGDYNTVLDHEFCINFLKNANLVNSLDIAKAAGTLKNNVGGSGTLGIPRKDMTGGGQIDNIFVTNNMKVLRHETILWNCVEHVSDHSPKYADIFLGN